jgi:hypothetical protein
MPVVATLLGMATRLASIPFAFLGYLFMALVALPFLVLRMLSPFEE